MSSWCVCVCVCILSRWLCAPTFVGGKKFQKNFFLRSPSGLCAMRSLEADIRVLDEIPMVH